MKPDMKPVQYYGCCQCQVQHFEDTDKALFDAHIMQQSKHGIQNYFESLDDRMHRYGMRFPDSVATRLSE